MLEYALGAVLPFLIAVLLSCGFSSVSKRFSSFSRLPYKLCAFCIVVWALFALGWLLNAMCTRFVREAESLLTGLSLYDDIAKHAGAGTLVPITGFANAIAAPAVEFKTEGFILGVGAKMFTIAGPVIVYGVSASVVYGFIYWITTLLIAEEAFCLLFF